MFTGIIEKTARVVAIEKENTKEEALKLSEIFLKMKKG